MFKCHISNGALNGLDNAIELICKEMDGGSTWKVIALAKVLRDITVARAIFTEITGVLEKF